MQLNVGLPGARCVRVRTKRWSRPSVHKRILNARPNPQRIMLFIAIMNPTAFAIIWIEASDVVHGTECKCQREHQLSKRG